MGQFKEIAMQNEQWELLTGSKFRLLLSEIEEVKEYLNNKIEREIYYQDTFKLEHAIKAHEELSRIAKEFG